MTHEGKYDDFVVNSYLQYDKDKNNSITGRSITVDDNGTPNNSKDDVIVTNPGGILFKTITANTQGTYFFDKHSLTLGGRYLKENLEDGTTNQNEPYRVCRRLFYLS